MKWALQPDPRVVALAGRSAAGTSQGGLDRNSLASPLCDVMDRGYLGHTGWLLVATTKTVEPGAWVEARDAPPQGRRLKAGQELGPHQKAGAGLKARYQGKVQAWVGEIVLHVRAPGS